MSRVYNFSAGPSCLPEDVLKECAAEMLDYNGTGQSVMEMSHRSAAFEPIIADAEAMVRKLMNVPENYKILFLQGGGSTQFAMVAENLGIHTGKAAYIETGVWAKKAAQEAAKLGIEVTTIASSKDKNYSYIPRVEKIEGDYDYAYICFNNTIMGTHYEYIPETGNIPLVADISSCVLSEELDVSKFGLLFAGAQKNLAPAGVTLVIIREDLITDTPRAGTPTMLTYKTHAEADSMYNTPPCYTIYVLDKVLHWIEKNGGAKGINKLNVEKAEYLYNYLDNSDFYHATAEKGSRSLMNVPFLTKYSTGATDEESLAKEKAINSKFVKEAEAAGLMNLKGHRLVGGMRASIYNAMTLDGVKALVAFMEKFAKENK
ncbi:MAG: 3-phosphoserine/phosphohydroxythreonine transaminase [Treponema sp.]|nr:3-phosphoserine/phosphohydroxythreonine transaminase [Treponema sp.]